MRVDASIKARSTCSTSLGGVSIAISGAFNGISAASINQGLLPPGLAPRTGLEVADGAGVVLVGGDAGGRATGGGEAAGVAFAPGCVPGAAPGGFVAAAGWA